ncbi:hypothetical protein NBH00_07410 [Paraconexibacter antarcticus]|uniref:Uncharacterized protein n=1 Tax=Paraconexibacter antarcticus TaxID=2949664 RepID=A0ABY5DWZ2_9ACTN|nr:hypothetical protein [Paraconexibacter antarcticus]UTI66025.1 hypothetical protein NBH00_07410 [Paraconexibacter antarcticus]
MAATPDPQAILERLAAIPDRGSCSDGERLAARQAARELRAFGRTGVRTQTFWVRPSGELVAIALALAGVAATVVSVDHPATGLGLAAAAVLLLAGDLSGRLPLLRWLTVAHATQNVVATGGRPEAAVRLVVTAALDTPRGGLLDGDGLVSRAVGRLRRRLGGRLPGRYGLLLLALVATAAGAGARLAGGDSTVLGVAQLAACVPLLVLIALLADAATVRAGRPGAGANASAAAVALALVAELDRRPPRALAVDLVLAGAGECGALGMRRWVADARRAGTKAEDVAVLHVAACGRGTPVWWTREGRVLALRYHPQLVAAAARAAADEAHLRARPHASRRATGGRAARAAGWPAIAVGCVGPAGIAPGGGRDVDTADTIDPDALDGTLELCLGLVRVLDAELSARGLDD